MATSTLGSGTLVLAGTTSGTTTVTATAVAGTTTLTLPAATDTLVGKATTDTLTNKTLTSPTITGGALNGTLGATTPSTGAFTTMSATTGAAVGGATAGAGGLAFPATAVAVANANTLDDYEEGTFTPTCTLSTPGTSSSGSAVGVYTKVGNLVTVTGRLTFTKGTGTGDLSFGGLPFTSTSTTTYQNSGAISLDSFGVTGKVYFFFLANSSTAPVMVSSTQAGGTVALAGATDFGAAGAGIRYMFSYQTD